MDHFDRLVKERRKKTKRDLFIGGAIHVSIFLSFHRSTSWSKTNTHTHTRKYSKASASFALLAVGCEFIHFQMVFQNDKATATTITNEEWMKQIYENKHKIAMQKRVRIQSNSVNCIKQTVQWSKHLYSLPSLNNIICKQKTNAVRLSLLCSQSRITLIC